MARLRSVSPEGQALKAASSDEVQQVPRSELGERNQSREEERNMPGLADSEAEESDDESDQDSDDEEETREMGQDQGGQPERRPLSEEVQEEASEEGKMVRRLLF